LEAAEGLPAPEAKTKSKARGKGLGKFRKSGVKATAKAGARAEMWFA
jgi:hypothetical protein